MLHVLSMNCRVQCIGLDFHPTRRAKESRTSLKSCKSRYAACNTVPWTSVSPAGSLLATFRPVFFSNPSLLKSAVHPHDCPCTLQTRRIFPRFSPRPSFPSTPSLLNTLCLLLTSRTRLLLSDRSSPAEPARPLSVWRGGRTGTRGPARRPRR
jgi:hypothetical protein